MHLTKIEIDLIDKFLLDTCVEEVTSAHVLHAIANTMPSFRAEQLVYSEPDVVTQYFESLNG